MREQLKEAPAQMEKHLEHTELYVQEQRRMHQRRVSFQKATGSDYDVLVANAAQHLADGDVGRAEEISRLAIASDPDRPTAHHALGCVCHRTGRGRDAAAAYARAAELCSPDTTDWANCVSRAFYEYNNPACKDAPKPEWWHDEALKHLSARVVAAAPAYTTLRMRAVVLAADDCAWKAGARTAAELNEAAACWERTARLSPDPERKRFLANRGVECSRQADEARIAT